MHVWAIWSSPGVCACERGSVSALNKRLLDGGFGAKSWLGIVINHRPSGWILTSLYSFICCCCSASSSAVYAYPVDIQPLLSPPLFGWPSSLFLSLSIPLPSSLLLPHLFCCPPHSLRFPSSRPSFSRPGQARSLPKTLFSSSARLIDSAGAKGKKKEKKRYIAHNLFMLPFDMCDI